MLRPFRRTSSELADVEVERDAGVALGGVRLAVVLGEDLRVGGDHFLRVDAHVDNACIDVCHEPGGGLGGVDDRELGHRDSNACYACVSGCRVHHGAHYIHTSMHTMSSSYILDLEVQLLGSMLSLEMLGIECPVSLVPHVEHEGEEGGDSNHTSPCTNLPVVHTYLLL